MSLCIALLAGEPSGDSLGAALMRDLKALDPSIRFIGVGGPQMVAEGLSSYFPMERLSVMGLVEVLGRLPELFWRRQRLVRALVDARPNVFVGIDAPDFNLGVELRLRRAGISTVHYVSPSVWAWRSGRIRGIRAACELMLCLFSFEARFYQMHGQPVKVVGHPLAATVPLHPDRERARFELGLSAQDRVVALLPGSRGGEVKRLAPLFLETAQRIRQALPGVRFLIPAANPARLRQLQTLLGNCDLPVLVREGAARTMLEACDAVLIASGTATLEAMLYKRPMVVAYRLTRLTHALAKRLVKIPYVALPNLLANRPLVPELLQDAATPEALSQALLSLLAHPDEQVDAFERLHLELREGGTESAARAVYDKALG